MDHSVRSCLKPFLLLLSVLAMPFPIMAEDLRLDRISRDDGLANSSVSSIVQDKWGFLWFGTQGGLNKYDGYGFKLYEHEPFQRNSLSQNLIQTMFLDSAEDTLWIGTYGGLNSFHIPSETFTAYVHDSTDQNSLSNDIVVAIAKDRSGRLWVGTLDGLNVMDPENGSFRRYLHDPDDLHSIQDNTIRSIIEDRNGTIWIGTNGGLHRFREETADFFRYPEISESAEGLSGKYVMTLLEDDEGTIWIGTWDKGLSSFNSRTETFTHHELPEVNIYSLNISRDGILQIGTWGQGFFEFDRASGKVLRSVHSAGIRSGLSHNIVYSLYEDRSGILWIGTNGGGINKYDRKKNYYPLYHHDPEVKGSLPPGKINSVYEDRSGQLWVGLYGGGLCRFEREDGSWTVFTHDPDNPESLSNNNVTDIFEDSRGRFWVATQDGLNIMDRNGERFSRMYPQEGNLNSLQDNIIYALEEDREGRIWIGTYHAGVSVYDPGSGSFDHFPHNPEQPDSLSDNLVFRIFCDSRGTIWIGTNNGLNRYNPETRSFTRYYHDPDNRYSLGSNTIRALYETSDGSIWIGTISGGLSRWNRNGNIFRHYGKEHGLPDNSITGILEDPEGQLWVSTPFGLSVYEKKEKIFRTLDEDNGILGREFNVGHCRSASGKLYFGSIEGLQEVDSSDLIRNEYIPPVVITDFRVFDKPGVQDTPIYSSREIDLSYKDSYFSFTFASLDYSSPGKNRYAYMLEGFDSDWIYSGRRNYVSYTNIPSGQYTFKVKGTNSDGLWNEEETRVLITIAAPPWKSWWANLLYALIIIAILYAIGEVRTTISLRQKVRELNATRDELRQANSKLEVLSTLDELTSIPNRRRFYEVLGQEWRNSIREKRPISIIMMDLDFFKAYNDNYGHPAGDLCLQMTARALSEAVERPRDLVARYGGEEFIILLPETAAEGANCVAEKIRRKIDELNIPHDFSEAGDHITVSLGISTAEPTPHISPEQCIQDADKALYQAKAEGRNRVVTYSYT